jgi:HAD superfamily hydrolase (TIGR01549 family)
MCNVFSAISCADATESLGARLRDAGVDLPPEVCQAADPFVLLRHVAVHAPHLIPATERALARLELDGVQSATPTHDLRSTLDALSAAGRTVSVVSDNSVIAVDAFLAAQELRPKIDAVAARTEADPALLRPNPHLLQRAVADLGTTADKCVLIGDSTSDVAAAHRAGTSAVALASAPDKRESLEAVRPDALIHNLAELVDALAS